MVSEAGQKAIVAGIIIVGAIFVLSFFWIFLKHCYNRRKDFTVRDPEAWKRELESRPTQGSWWQHKKQASTSTMMTTTSRPSTSSNGSRRVSQGFRAGFADGPTQHPRWSVRLDPLPPPACQPAPYYPSPSLGLHPAQSVESTYEIGVARSASMNRAKPMQVYHSPSRSVSPVPSPVPSIKRKALPVPATPNLPAVPSFEEFQRRQANVTFTWAKGPAKGTVVNDGERTLATSQSMVFPDQVLEHPALPYPK